MAEPTCLHIQDRESGPIRVVEIPWVSVRIGPASHCEVRLTEHDLAGEVCRLYRRAGSWHLVPVGSRSPILLDGRPVDGPCPLPFDVPFRVGHCCLTLRHDRAALPDWGMYSGPVPQQCGRILSELEAGHPAVPEPERDAVSPSRFETAPHSEPSALTRSPIEAAPLSDVEPAAKTEEQAPAHAAVRAAAGRQSWDTRWKAVGAELKARSERARINSESKQPMYHAPFDAVSLKEPRVPRVETVATPPKNPAERPVPTPPALKVEPDWAGPKVESAWTGAKAQPDCTVPRTEPPEPRAHAHQSWKTWNAREEPMESSWRRLHRGDREARPGPPAEERRGESASPALPRAPKETPASGTSPAVAASAIELDATPPAPPHGLEEDLPPPKNPGVALPAVAMEGGEAEPAVNDLVAAIADDSTRAASKIEPTTGSTVVAGRVAAAANAAPNAAPPQERLECDVHHEPQRSQAAPAPARLAARPKTTDRDSTTRAVGRGRERAREEKEAGSTSRHDVEAGARDSNRCDADAALNRMEWPSAKDILATHRATPAPCASMQTGRATKGGLDRSSERPTLAREPGHWMLPVWLAGPPAAIFVLTVGLAGCVLSCWWASDSYSASIMTDRLLSPDRSALRRPLRESARPPDGTWTHSTAGNLAHWAIFLTRYTGGENQRPEAVRALLEKAIQASPINRAARLALAQLEPATSDPAISFRSLGLSRDSVCLAWSASRLLEAGKKDAALKMYGQALAVAVPSESSRAGVPRFSDDPGIPRYLLPGEERVREIVRDLVSSNQWPFSEWSAIVPRNAIICLAAARMLREQGRGEAEGLLDVVLEEPERLMARLKPGPLTLAARAEACALRSRWREADQLYRQAIESIDDDTIKRSWWFNLADIAFRLDDERQRQAALRAALAVATSDDITRRASDIQRAIRARPLSRSMGVRAN